MSFLWHGLTEQGAQVPVQVDAQGRVIAVDGTPGVSNWERTGTTLFPAIPGDSAAIGGTAQAPNISLNANGTGQFKNTVFIDGPVGSSATAALLVRSNSTQAQHSLCLFRDNSDIDRAAIRNNGNFLIGGTLPSAPNISLNADGSATFAGNITAPNVTFRSADPQFYVKKSKNKDAQPEYVGPELDLLAEIARLEALVRHLYETLRITPPAGWPVWDGNDDVLRQLRK